MTFAEKFYSLRKEAGLSQEECAENIGVSRQAISRWEIGTATPDMQNLLAISKLFSVSTDYLIRDDIDNRSADTETSSSNYLIRDEIDDKKADIPKSSPEETAAHEKKKTKTYSTVKNAIISALIKLPSFLLLYLAAKQIDSSQGIFTISIIFAVLFMYDFSIGTMNFRPEHNKINDTARKNFLFVNRIAYIGMAFITLIVFIGAPESIRINTLLYTFYATLSLFFSNQFIYTRNYIRNEKSEAVRLFRVREISFSIWFILFHALSFMAALAPRIFGHVLPIYVYAAVLFIYIAVCLTVTLVCVKYIKAHKTEE